MELVLDAAVDDRSASWIWACTEDLGRLEEEPDVVANAGGLYAVCAGICFGKAGEGVEESTLEDARNAAANQPKEQVDDFPLRVLNHPNPNGRTVLGHVLYNVQEGLHDTEIIGLDLLAALSQNVFGISKLSKQIVPRHIPMGKNNNMSLG